ncbi:NERD domain-containing protein [Filobacillus milosensis]|uniref:NERD domain-containing protein n=1 Tax=Filobacillus milosensis TaxID=94137 RepID=A0A4Y8ITY4_9BACI|nr:nuclease-related domain-containing protein [Filobacillus milosensis]TFB24386.1 NERD domain-containing protein [Filobacillus milosensis]
MIIKNHEPPHKLLVAESLKRRLITQHHFYGKVNEIFLMERAGFFGELKVDYPLSKLNFKHVIAHDLRLPFYQNYFQMDTLLLNPRILLILEVKNLPGIVSFDLTANKMIRTRDGVTDYYDDPVIQVKEQAFQLSEWLETHGYSNVPIEYLVVMANQETILDIDSSYHEHLEKVVPIYGLSQKIRSIYSSYSTDFITYSNLFNLGQLMVDHHTPAKVDLMKKLGITKENLIRGAFCPKCSAVPMMWKGRRWQCWSCNHRSLTAHLPGLKDYYLLLGDQISKQEFMWFMNLKSDRTAKHLLNKENLIKNGSARGITHELNYNLEKDFNDIIF